MKWRKNTSHVSFLWGFVPIISWFQLASFCRVPATWQFLFTDRFSLGFSGPSYILPLISDVFITSGSTPTCTVQSTIQQKSKTNSVYIDSRRNPVRHYRATFHLRQHVYRICRNKRPGRLFSRSNKQIFITHQKPSVLCTPPFEKPPIQGHRFCVLPPLKNDCFWWALISRWAFISANAVLVLTM